MILKIYDNPKYFDRYTVYLSDTECLGMSENPLSPLGFCQHSTGKIGKHNGKEIQLSDLPEACKKALKNLNYIK
jgi:hypothetical protein